MHCQTFVFPFVFTFCFCMKSVITKNPEKQIKQLFHLHNWFACLNIKKLFIIQNHYAGISKPIEHNDPTPSPNLEFLVFEAEEDDVEGDSWWDYPSSWAPKERIQLYHENQQNSQTGALQMQSKKKWKKRCFSISFLWIFQNFY